jgi:flagellin
MLIKDEAMAISLGINVQSLNAQRNLTNTTGALSSVYQQLSSGQRINKASDDAAGLSIADGLRRDQRIATQAIRNANDGISVIAIADGALSEINNILNRMGELAQQSANGVFNNDQRSALALEFNELGSEISRITFNTEFNSVKLLSSGESLSLQVGFTGNSNSQVTLRNVTATVSSIGLATAASGQAVGYSISANTIVNAQSASRLALDAVRTAVGSVAALRGALGAGESRLRSAVNSMSIMRENWAAAESQIRDADIASSAAELTRLNILQQAGSSILGQANQQPQLALSLIG